MATPAAYGAPPVGGGYDAQQYAQYQQQQQQYAQQAAAAQQYAAAPAPTPAAATTDGLPPVVVDTQHDDMVHDAQLDYYGTKLATCSSDRTVRIYSVTRDGYQHAATLQGHTGPVWEVSWCHPRFGTMVASCSFDGSVLIHRELRQGSWQLLHAARNLHESSVNSIQFAPYDFGLKLATASSDGRIAILTFSDALNEWSAPEYISVNALGVNAVSWSPPRPSVAPGDDGEDSEEKADEGLVMRLVSGGCDNRVRFWISRDGGAWEPDETYEVMGPGHSEWVRDVAWAPALIPGQSTVASCSEDCTVLIWTLRHGESDPKWRPTVLNKFDGPVWRVSWSVSGSVLAVCSGDNNVTLWKADVVSPDDADRTPGETTWSQLAAVPDSTEPPAGTEPSDAAPPAADGPPPTI